MKHDDLGIRMKTFYEEISKTRLMRRTPVAIRLDGRSFHSFTQGFKKPFDKVLIKSMQQTMKYLCENIQGCVLGYTQSDEITLILIDYKKLTSSAWFDYEVQKMCSITASMATMAFNQFFLNNVYFEVGAFDKNRNIIDKDYFPIYETHVKAANKGAMFDARCFNIPKEEVANLIYWRQLDATRNSIQALGQANFSHKELQNKSCNDIQNMLITQKHINWNDLPTELKRGSCCIYVDMQNPESISKGDKIKGWMIDTEIPIFKDEDRKYINSLIYVGE